LLSDAILQLEFFWGMPPDPSSISMLCMLSVSYPFSSRILPARADLRGVKRDY